MKKIPTGFIRVFENHKIVDVKREYTNLKCKEAILYGKPTIKWDGSCCAIINGVFYKRYDAKKGKPIPSGAIKCQDAPDEITGHLPCWVKVDKYNQADKWFIKALETYANEYYRYTTVPDGTYEAVGKHFNGNPYKHKYDILVPHGKAYSTLEDRSYDGIKKYLSTFPQEGIVFWLDNEPICKIKRTDFGYDWPIKEDKE